MTKKSTLKHNMIALVLLTVGSTSFHSAAIAEGAHWSYAHQNEWGTLSPDFTQCVDGTRQSPIDIIGAKPAELPEIMLRYKKSTARVFNNGHTIQAEFPEGSFMHVGELRYQLLQLHFHLPSEHAVEAHQWPMELHFVHKNDAGELGVLGVMIEEGAASSYLQQLWDRIPSQIGKEFAREVEFDPVGLSPASLSYYEYPGSLTTPPCSQGVHWRVAKTPITASKEQIGTFRSIIGESARHLQKSNQRVILEKK